MNRVRCDVRRARLRPPIPRAFSLVELLVVISIIALLIAILVPTFRGARDGAKRTACAATLRQAGIALFAYMEDNNHRFPHASAVPSIGPAPLSVADPIRIADLLTPYAQGQDKVLQCPADVPGRTRRSIPNVNKSFFETEGSSYEYRWMGFGSSIMGKTITEVVQTFTEMMANATPENSIWLMRDYENFHGKAGEPGSRRYLYIDGHVADFENL